MKKPWDQLSKKQQARRIRDQQIMDIYGDLGSSDRTIAEVFDISPRTVGYVIRKNLTPEERAERVAEHRRKVHKNFRKV